MTKRASDPGPGNVVNARVAWRNYYAPTPPDATDLSRSYDVWGTSEPCFGPSDYHNIGSQIRADDVRTVVYDLNYPAVVAAPSPQRLPDGSIRRVVVNAVSAYPPRLAVGGRGDIDPRHPNRMAPIIATKNGIDRNQDGALDVVVNSPTWLVDIDAKQSYGYVDLREVPVPALSTMRAEIGTRNPKATHIKGYVGPVTFFGPTGTVNMYVDVGDAPDRITLGAGHDHVYASGGSDVIRTGDGDDVVWGGGGKHDLIYTEAGNDYVNGDDGRGGGRDTIYLGPGNDAGFGSGGNGNRVYGQDGNDFMSTGGRRGLLDFGSGNDFAFSWEPDTRVNCGAGLLDTGPSKKEHHAGFFSGCEKAFAHPLTPQPYVASSNHLRSYWCGGARTDKNYCRTVDLYD
ncbi:MAG: hypothetical protein H7287_04230 [Thermoleophilia bacterium]|nr:hypothetical protein [Thermoleophilia bacterium]